MTSVYDILDKVKDFLRAGDFTNTVTFGNLSEIDINKENVYPLAHLKIDNVNLSPQTIEFNLKIIVADVIDYSKENLDPDIDKFYGNDDLQDVFNTQLQVLNSLHQHMVRGDLRDDNYHVQETLSATPFVDRFDMELAGWEANIFITIQNRYRIC